MGKRSQRKRCLTSKFNGLCDGFVEERSEREMVKRPQIMADQLDGR